MAPVGSNCWLVAPEGGGQGLPWLHVYRTAERASLWCVLRHVPTWVTDRSPLPPDRLQSFYATAADAAFLAQVGFEEGPFNEDTKLVLFGSLPGYEAGVLPDGLTRSAYLEQPARAAPTPSSPPSQEPLRVLVETPGGPLAMPVANGCLAGEARLTRAETMITDRVSKPPRKHRSITQTWLGY